MGLIDMLLDDPMLFLRYTLFRVPTLLIALTLHELAHGYVAMRCGDNTAKSMGRLTFNPLKHLDPIGTLLMFTVGFGWAKPVPVNPNNFRDKRWDDLKVSLAGVSMNFLLFLAATIIALILNRVVWEPFVLAEATPRDLLSITGGLYNVFLYPGEVPLDLVMRSTLLGGVLYFFGELARINLFMGIFNLFPIPPLDGFHVLNDIAFGGKAQLSGQVFRFGMMAVMLISFTTDWLSNVMLFLATHIQNAVLWICALIPGI